jgi:hypothetical protein
MGIPLRGLLHDLSKFLPSEFIPYANYFSVNPHDEVMKDSAIDCKFDKAWLNHQHRNPHHYQWWILREDGGKDFILEMEDKCILEMFCDWVGAAKAQGKFSPKDDKYQKVREWYLKNMQNMQFNGKTRQTIEAIIGWRISSTVSSIGSSTVKN